MSNLKKIALAVALTGVVAGPAFAQQPQWSESNGNMYDLRAMAFSADGKIATGKLTDRGLGDMMKSARPISGGAVIFRHNGRFYMMEDTTGSAYSKFRDMVTMQ